MANTLAAAAKPAYGVSRGDRSRGPEDGDVRGGSYARLGRAQTGLHLAPHLPNRIKNGLSGSRNRTLAPACPTSLVVLTCPVGLGRPFIQKHQKTGVYTCNSTPPQSWGCRHVPVPARWHEVSSFDTPWILVVNVDNGLSFARGTLDVARNGGPGKVNTPHIPYGQRSWKGNLG